MATYAKLPSGKWRVQVRKAGMYRGATFSTKADAKAWAAAIENQATYVAAVGYVLPPKGSTLEDLIKKYIEMSVAPFGKTKRATLNMLIERIGSVPLVSLSATVLRDFIDGRVRDGAGGVTIAADLSFLSAVLKWGRYSRRLNLPDRLALDARDSLKHLGLKTRSFERSREPTDSELNDLYEYWAGNQRQKIDMPILVRFALATGMRLGEITSIRVEDVDRGKKTVLIRDRKHPRKNMGITRLFPYLMTPGLLLLSVLKVVAMALFLMFELPLSVQLSRELVRLLRLRISDSMTFGIEQRRISLGWDWRFRTLLL
ncbi:TPA: tyrosine-type recombinase/integrase [Pseudomonas aeruginosa]|uniref:tyrosine-type recombinase/integrase n=1 Tax=Pseudomonas aeruginosa TaxID=287 RepID=UPI001596A38F|nr:tyrosine-type recombinase/integrase [Pseudomonas aeruginosa]HEK2500653.1 tyrosine-type recombinase/integrase [Pseudomonas aeruginosa]